MRLRYLLPGLLLLALGLLVGRLFIYYGFAGMLLCAIGAAVLVFGAVDALKKRWPRAMRRTQRVLCVLLVLVLVAATATGIWGAINGVGVAYAKVPSFIMTMCTMLAARGLAYIYTNAKAIFFLSDRFVNIANGFINRTFDEAGTLVNFGIPYMVFYFIAAMAIGIVVLQCTSYGRKVYAVGGNAVSARYSGINVKWITCSTYIISGLCAGICGFLMASRISSGNANAADGYEMTVIAAAVIGGVSMSGGIGTMTGTTIGVLIIGVISNGMDILGVNSYFQKVLQAIIIFAAVYVDGRLNAKKK